MMIMMMTIMMKWIDDSEHLLPAIPKSPSIETIKVNKVK